ncbi:hypothetical protein B6N58_04785 [Legionella micdadei]|uniref:APC family permease n=1 Tax=Legionella micdadei TaxID=451 RepID=UPI0009EF8014|nr:APC family permease [Legionella micdadei]ARG97039.1 hypothetical protein B6N58_04785 [Legionella micdadei]
MSLIDKILGKPLTLRQRKKQELSILTGIPALGLDSFASTAYGPEAALMILLPLGMAGLHYFSFIMLAVIAVLIMLYLSYQQTTAAYPQGGGAYIVASDNFGKKAGIWAAIALLIDYLLNVAVGISAGVGAVVSAIPILQPYTLLLCLLVLTLLTFLNLRGVRESGLAFVTPTLLFIVCISIAMLIGLFESLRTGGHPQPLVSPPEFPPATETISGWLILSAIANGLTAMTGIEAVSNAVPLFRNPRVRNARWTLTVILLTLALFLLILGYLIPTYHIVAMDEKNPGYQTILSQLIAVTTGKGIFYYFSIFIIFFVLVNSAQTSFIAFPRVCRFLAEDHFLPHFFAERGRRLVFSYGIILLAIFAGLLLILFKGITLSLIPLFAVGAFTAFLFSQSGMVVYWLRNKNKPMAKIKLFFNALGATSTALALIIIIAAKFIEGAWIVVVLIPMVAFLMLQIRRHYKKIAREIGSPLELDVAELKPPVVVVPIQNVDRVAVRAIEFAMLLSDDITAVLIDREGNEQLVKELWDKNVVKPAKKKRAAVPKLKIVKSPYRFIYGPFMRFIKKVKKEKPGQLIAIIIPELIEPHWYEFLLHNVHATGFRTLLFLERDQRTIIITIPWYLRESRT